MKRRHVKKTKKRTRNKSREPLAEGTIPLNARGYRDWASMSDDELVDYAKKFVKERGISGRWGLQKADSGLYGVLGKRKLLDKVGFEEKGRKGRDWRSLSDAQLIEHARQFMEERGISSRTELAKADVGLYEVLRTRKLLDRVGFEEKRKKGRDWSLFSDAQLIEHAREFMEKRGVSGRWELCKADKGLYLALWKRKLMDRIGFEEKRRKMRDWKSLSDEQLVEHAKQFMKKRGISSKGELQKADSGLYHALRRRKLINRVFEDIDQANKREEIRQIVEGVREFGGAG